MVLFSVLQILFSEGRKETVFVSTKRVQMEDPGLKYKSVLLKSQYFHTSSWPSKICKIVVFNLYPKRSGHNENYGVEKYTGDDMLMLSS